MRSVWAVLHRMKAYIDKFQPNAGQANCFEGFWRITSKTNASVVLQRLKLIITFNQDFQGVESTSDMTQFSQNIDKNTQKKQNSLRQLRF